MNGGLQLGLNCIGKDKVAPILGDISVEPITLADAASKDNHIGIDEIDDMGESPCQPLFVTGHAGLGRWIPLLRGRHDLRPRPTLPRNPKIIGRKSRA